MFLHRQPLVIGVGIFVSTLVLYRLTAYPTVAYIDSGELAVVNWTLGIAHPTGYPLYTLLGRLFALIPAELITTQNLLGGLCTSAALAVFFWMLVGTLCLEQLIEQVTAALVVLLAAVSPLVWSQGVTNEVYALHLLFVVLLLWFLVSSLKARTLIIGGYLFGASFGNHMSTVLLVPALLAYLVQHRYQLRRSSRVVACAAATVVLSLTVYIYLPLRAAQAPFFNWGNPSTLDALIRHVTGWQYQVWMFNRSGSELWGQVVKFAGLIWREYPPLIWPVIIWGMICLLRGRTKTAVILSLVGITNLVYSLNFSIPDIDNYLLPTTIVLAIALVVGISDLLRRYPKLAVAGPLLVLVSIIWSAGGNWNAQNQHRNYAALDGIRNFYVSAPERPALIFCANWDYVSQWFYSHFYLKEEPDVLIVDQELVRRSWYFDWIRQADSSLYSHIRSEVEAFLPHLRRFESGKPYQPAEIERAFQAVLSGMSGYPERFFYFDPSTPVIFRVPGEMTPSGRLVRVLREGESATLPPQPLRKLRFGKPDEALDWRERWHRELLEQTTESQNLEFVE